MSWLLEYHESDDKTLIKYAEETVATVDGQVYRFYQGKPVGYPMQKIEQAIENSPEDEQVEMRLSLSEVKKEFVEE